MLAPTTPPRHDAARLTARRRCRAAADAPRRAWIYPATADQRQALAAAAATLGKAERIETVSRTLSRTAERGCGSPVALLLPADAAAADLNAPDGKVAPLARASAIVHVLEAGGRSLRVHPNDKTSVRVRRGPSPTRFTVFADDSRALLRLLGLRPFAFSLTDV